MTHEPELTEPVDLCRSDGTLDPAARGWSRFPLHRANLSGYRGRNKRWDYWAILAGDLVVSCVYADIDVIGLADVYWADLTTGDHGGQAIIADAGVLHVPETVGGAPLRVTQGTFSLDLVDDERGTAIIASWVEDDGRPGRLGVVVDRPEGHESLNVVIPWDAELFNFTSKQQARPAAGELVVGDRRWEVGGASGDAWGVLDVGRGRWPSDITWNWGGGAGRAGDHVVGLQFGAKWTEGTGFTENGVLVDGRLTKIGRELDWDYDWDEPMRPWTVHDPGGQLHVVLEPRLDKHTKVGDGERASETHQVFGTWSGELTTDDGLRLVFDDVQGFAEEARQHW